jgi:hypothetical protein
MEKTQLAADIERLISVTTLLLPYLFFVYPIVCGILASLAHRGSIDGVKSWLGEMVKSIAVAYAAAAVYFFMVDKSFYEIMDGGKYFYGFTAFVLLVPLFYKPIISDSTFQYLFSSFIAKKLGLSKEELGKMPNAKKEDKEDKE